MTNEKVAKKICTYTCHYERRDMNCHKDCATFKDIMAMAKWKDKQFAEQKKQLIEKACEWLNNNTITTTPSVYTYTASSYNIDKKTFIEQFKKAMKE